VDLIAYLKKYGKVGSIKHAHELDFDTSKDTGRFFNAGADVVMGVSDEKTVKISGTKNLKVLIDDMADSDLEFVLVEGFKSSDLPKIALNDFPDDEARNIIARIDIKGNSRSRGEILKEIVQVIRALDDY
jgi:molybdopterin synthase catalytic subunit